MEDNTIKKDIRIKSSIRKIIEIMWENCDIQSRYSHEYDGIYISIDLRAEDEWEILVQRPMGKNRIFLTLDCGPGAAADTIEDASRFLKGIPGIHEGES